MSYEVHTNVTSPNLLSQVGQIIRHQHNGRDFAGIWMLVAEWSNVAGHLVPQKGNTFQAVVITNAFRSYAIFVYNCTDITWNAGGSAVVGFQADKDYYANHPLSRTTNVDDIACSNSDSTFTNVVYQLSRFTFHLLYIFPHLP